MSILHYHYRHHYVRFWFHILRRLWMFWNSSDINNKNRLELNACQRALIGFQTPPWYMGIATLGFPPYTIHSVENQSSQWISWNRSTLLISATNEFGTRTTASDGGRVKELPLYIMWWFWGWTSWISASCNINNLNNLFTFMLLGMGKL